MPADAMTAVRQTRDIARAHGFRFTTTGGSCTAFSRRVGGGAAPIFDLLLTHQWYPQAPASLWEPAALGVYDEAGDLQGDILPYPSMLAALEAADRLEAGEEV